MIAGRLAELDADAGRNYDNSGSGTGAGGASFFFQAEDGIRDYKVTGVQTCALPIYCPRGCSRVHLRREWRRKRSRRAHDSPALQAPESGFRESQLRRIARRIAGIRALDRKSVV